MLNRSCLLAGLCSARESGDYVSPGVGIRLANLATNAAVTGRGGASGKTNQLSSKGHRDIFT